jgi:lysophospholipase L1-like esterase
MRLRVSPSRPSARALVAPAALALGLLSVTASPALVHPAGPGRTASAAPEAIAAPRPAWQAAWRASPQQPFPTGVSHDGFADQTVRMRIRAAASGQQLRIRLSNAYGASPVRIDAATVAVHRSGPTVVGRSLRRVTFHGRRAVTLPVGGELHSDGVAMRVTRGEVLDVSLHFPVATGPTTWHYEAESTTYVSTPGDWTREPGGSPYQLETPSWFYLDGLDVHGRPSAGAVVAFGDSITDGHYSTIDADGRWPDWLNRRTPRYTILDEGIGGNQILTDVPTAGESALHRMSRDVVGQLRVSSVIFLEGINDIGSSDANARQVISGMRRVITVAHAHCLPILGGTLTPFKGAAYYTPAKEKVRERVNHWVRTSGAFDGVVDFDAAVRDPSDPLTLDPRFDTGGGHLHPNDQGYRAMAEAVPLGLLHASLAGCS